MSSELLSPRMRAFAVAVLLGLLAWVAQLVRARRLSLRDSLLWLLSTSAALVVAVFPGLLLRAAQALQITLPSNALFALTFVYVLANLLSLTLGMSASASHVRRLTQECALLRAEIQLLKGGRGAAPGSGEDGPEPPDEGAPRA